MTRGEALPCAYRPMATLPVDLPTGERADDEDGGDSARRLRHHEAGDVRGGDSGKGVGQGARER